MASYIENFSKLDWAMPFQRTGKFPLDRTAMFSSVSDAESYAKGDGSDSRALGGTSYIGQILTVYENDTVNVYVINQNRTLTKLASGGSADEIAQNLQAEITRSIAKDTEHSNAISTITDVTLPALKAELSVTVTESAGSGDVLKSYSFKQGDVALGTIDIPKDFLVKSATVETCTEADNPIAGLAVGDKYLDFVLNTKDSTGTDGTHIYVNLKDLTDVYTAGNTATISVDVSNDNVITAALIEKSVGTNHIIDGAVTTDKINGKAVTTEKIADLAVTTDKIANVSVTEAKLATDSVTTGKIANDAVTNDKIAANAVHGEQINDGAVSSNKIVDGAVTTAKIADENVTTDKLATGSVTDAKLATDSVTTVKIKDGNVTGNKIADGAVTTAKIADGNVTKAKLSSDVTEYIAQQLTDAKAYTNDAINKLSVDNINIGADSVITKISETAGKIAVETGKIQISASQVTGLDDALTSFVKNADFSQISGDINNRLNTVSSDLDDLESTVTTIESTVETINSDYLKAADKTELNNAIDAEKTRAETAEAGLQSAIDAEKTRATGAESELQANIDAEKTRAEAAEGNLQKAIDDEESRATGIEAGLRTDVNKANSTLESFAELSNAIGLSAASSTNTVVTQKDIATLTNVMHFMGVTTTELSTGSTALPAGITFTGPDGKPVAGDIVLGPNAKEFIWANGQWHEIGKEGIYATSAELEAEAKARADADTALANRLTNIEDDYLKLADKTELQDKITTEEDAREAADAYLSSAIDNKIYCGNYGSVVSADSLSVVKISQDDYHNLVVNNKVDDKAVYVINNDSTYNMYGGTISELSTTGIEGKSEAANTLYVDEKVAEAKAAIQATIPLSVSQLIWDIEAIYCGNAGL